MYRSGKSFLSISSFSAELSEVNLSTKKKLASCTQQLTASRTDIFQSGFYHGIYIYMYGILYIWYIYIYIRIRIYGVCIYITDSNSTRQFSGYVCSHNLYHMDAKVTSGSHSPSR